MKNKTEKLLALLDGQPVIPVLKIGDVAHAVPLARALVAGGLPAIEITLRTPAALDAIRAVAKEVPEAVVGAGTILSGEDFVKAADAGSRFIVSPGSTPELLETAEKSDVPLLPGATTPSEIMVLQARGYEILKFFPAEQSGGLPFLKALASPLAAIRFCPTGGISLKNAPDYLAQPNIVCVGGSWVAPDADIEAGNWQRIEELAREASQLKKR
ncbi:2-dehydro-3-deoxy-phosphogluconate aldolase [Nitratireductor aestuarii]|uniref:2-dehydro-3-deoxy-phosphogluconate aldolase n=1 Tax=Nitratireductor aestuarii TaxID=1735103 RepID=A0A916RNT5_9HYPH|nr:2-dehydro-3-deoxy-phosphogluconate aldolase [Nitratireductor aestuarii]GGA64169.1 2-dehydro-3-deoxy-phosphogluconate aldolase [Nitratireductor aestuarii]